MIDPTKKTGLLAAGLLAAALGGRAPSADPGEIAPSAKDSFASCRLLVPGSCEVVVGHVDPGGPVDREAFTLVAERPCRVRFRLTPTLPGTDLDLWVQDRAHGVETTEIAIAKAGERLDLVVRSAWGSSCYSLEIEAR